MPKMPKKTLEQAKKDLADFLPHLQLALGAAKVNNPEGKLQLAIASVNPDGSGQLGARFETEFVEDLAILVESYDPA